MRFSLKEIHVEMSGESQKLDEIKSAWCPEATLELRIFPENINLCESSISWGSPQEGLLHVFVSRAEGPLGKSFWVRSNVDGLQARPVNIL